jgi:hypothetical protein
MIATALVVALVTATPAWAQLTPQQMAAIHAAINEDAELAAIPNNFPDGATQLAAALNATFTPGFTVWKTAVGRNEVGKTFVAHTLASITSANNDRLANFAAWNDVIDPSRADQRQFFDDVFSGPAGAPTRAALDVLWRRPARYIEKILSTGAGTNTVPAFLVFEGLISPSDAHNARNLPPQ